MNEGLTEYTITCPMAIAALCESPIGHAIIDKDGKFLWINEAYCVALNARREQVLGTTWMKWTHADDVTLDTELAQKVHDGVIPHYRMVKKYKQLGHTSAVPRIVAGSLLVFGNYDDNGEFVNYRVTFDSYAVPEAHQLIDYDKWLTVLAGFLATNWKTVLSVLLALAGLTLSNSEKLSATLRDALQLKKDLDESVSGLSVPSSQALPGPSVPKSEPLP